MIRLALSDLRGHRLRTILSVIAVTLGVALVTGALTLTGSMTKAADSLSTAAYGGVDAAVTAQTKVDADDESTLVSQPTLPASELQRVAADPQVAHAAGEVQAEARMVGADGEVVGATPYFGVGYDFTRPGAADLTPFRLDRGRWPAGPQDVVIDAQTSRKEGLDPGETVRVSVDGAPVRSFTIVGVSTFGSVRSLGTATTALFDLRTAQALFGKQGRLDTILAAARSSVDAAAFRSGLDQRLPADARVRTAAAQDRFTLDSLKEFVGILRTILLVLGLVAVLVGAFTIANALAMSVAQQQRSLALLRAVGASRRQVRRLVAFQALTLGLAGSLFGVVAGLGLAHAIGALFDALGLSLPMTAMALSGGSLVVALLVGVGVPLLAAMRPARLATRISPVSAMRESVDGPQPGLVGRGVRRIASVLGRPAEWFGGVAGALARRNTMRRPGRTAATAAALTIGVTLVAAVGVLAAGLKGSVSNEARDRIAADLVVSSEKDGWGPTSPAALKRVAEVPGVERVGALAQDGALVGKTRVTVDGLDAAAARMVRYDVSAGRGELRTGEALVTESLAREHDLDVGGRLTLLAPNGDRVTVTVAGIAALSQLNVVGLGDVTLPWDTYSSAFGTDQLHYGLVEAAGDSGAARAAIAGALEGFPGAYVDSTENWAQAQAAWLDIVLMIVVAMLALAVLVSLLGIVNTLALSVVERTREIGLLRAAGMTRRQVRRMVRWESVLTASVGTIVGVGLGLGLGALAIALLPVEGISFVLPAGMLTAIVATAVVAGVVAAAIPARRAARLDVLQAVTVE